MHLKKCDQKGLDRSVLECLVLKVFTLYGKPLNDEAVSAQMIFFVDELLKASVEFGIDEKTMDMLISKSCQTSEFLPTVAFILRPIHKTLEIDENRDIDEKWAMFQKMAFSPYKKLPDWMYTIKKIIGASRCDGCTDRDFPFVKREFYELCRRYFSGQIPIQTDTREWVKIGGSYFLQKDKKYDNKISRVSGLIESNDHKKTMPNPTIMDAEIVFNAYSIEHISEQKKRLKKEYPEWDVSKRSIVNMIFNDLMELDDA